jgi:superfamily II DNA helicase RecQ
MDLQQNMNMNIIKIMDHLKQSDETKRADAKTKNRVQNPVRIEPCIGSIGNNDYDISLHQDINILIALRWFYENQNAGFRTPLQATAVKQAVYNPRDMLIVLPTGSGKSLSFFLCAAVNPKKCTVVVTPFLALKKDLLMHAKQHKIVVECWTVRTPDKHQMPQLLICSVEQVNSPSFKKWVIDKHEIITKLFFDEVHAMVTQVTFRDCMRELKSARCASIPIVCLSATVPVSMEKPIRNVFGIMQWDVIRDRTVRKNIQYKIAEATSESDVEANILKAIKDRVHAMSTTSATSDKV